MEAWLGLGWGWLLFADSFQFFHLLFLLSGGLPELADFLGECLVGLQMILLAGC